MRRDLMDSLFPRTKQNILATLLASTNDRWYLSDLAKRICVTPSSLQRELASLTCAGILLREQEGNRVYFRANLDFPLLPELQALFAKASGLIEPLKELLEQFDVEIDFAFIFGSVARSQSSSKSDVDLMIVGDVSLTGLSIPIRDLEKQFSVEINVVKYDRHEFISRLREQNHFLNTVLADKMVFLKGSADELANIASESKDQNSLNK